MQIRHLRLLVSSLVFAWAGVTAAADVSTLTLLDRAEPNPGAMLIQNGTLWVGKSRKELNADYTVEAYDPGHRLLSSAKLPHSINFIKAYTGSSVIATGFNPNSRLTAYSIISLSNGRMNVKSTNVALGGFATFWIGSVAGKNFFVDHGGNSNDNAPLGQPAQTIFSYNGFSSRYLTTRLSLPVDGATYNNQLLLVSREQIGSPSAKIVRVDPATHKMTVLVKDTGANFGEMAQLGSTSLFAANASGTNKVIIFDANNPGVKREFATQGYTRNVATAGHCVFAGNDETNTIEVFDVDLQSPAPVLTLSVDMPENDFSGIKKIAVDRSSGQIYARAALPCNPVMGDCNNDNNRIVNWDSETAAKVKSVCL